MQTALVTPEEVNEDMIAAAELSERVDQVRENARELLGKIDHAEEEILSLKDSVEDISREELIEAVECAYQALDEIRDQQYALVAQALDGRYTVADVRAWCERAVDMKAHHPHLDGKLIEDLIYLRKVPVAPLREAYVEIHERELVETGRDNDGEGQDANRGEVEITESYAESTIRQTVMKAMGWDERALKRGLGMNVRPAGTGGKKSLTLFLDYEAASRLALTLGLKPHAAGI